MFLLYCRAAKSQGHLAIAKNKTNGEATVPVVRTGACCGTGQSPPGQLFYSCPEQSRLTADPLRVMTDGQVGEPSNGPEVCVLHSKRMMEKPFTQHRYN